jgi:phosphomannomutase
MISVSGIRGVVGEALTADVVSHYAARLGTWLPPGPVVFGRDSRPSGPALRPAVLAALVGVGREVIDLGIVPTPTVQVEVERRHAAGGIALTASHNPVEWNALKLIGGDGRFLTATTGRAFLDAAATMTPAWKRWDALGHVVEVADPLAGHLELILGLDFLPVADIRARGFRVALDAVHGAGGAIGRRLLEALGCRFDILFEEPTGLFPRVAEPLAENLGILCGHVAGAARGVGTAPGAGGGYDIGLAFDPDVDRLSLVDETGRALGEEYTLALAARFVLERKQGPAVTNLSTSAMIDAVAARLGRTVLRTPVGEANVVEEMARSGAPIGGEGNGGVILPAVHLGRDAPVGVALILGLMAATGKKLSELAAELPTMAMVKARRELATPPDLALLEGPLGAALPGGILDRRDGLRVSRDGEWIHVRKSGTEPIVRVIAEAGDLARAEALCALALGTLGD